MFMHMRMQVICIVRMVVIMRMMMMMMRVMRPVRVIMWHDGPFALFLGPNTSGLNAPQGQKGQRPLADAPA
ncbi:hypothetical protein [Sagittula sp. SSi028]|uniref:hypothetical protein n=1 Tax=Sagittula sp. SSi028 TaxID=3400636 RepID=UPI003AF6103B